MTWEQKLAAMNALAPCELFMRAPGDWSCSFKGVSVGGDGFLTSSPASGATPEAAVDKRWALSTALKPGQHLAAGFAPTRRVRWNGFMWADVPA